MNTVLTTHVGSLPFTDVDKALDYTFKFDLPVLFSLPARNENEFMGKDIVTQLGLGQYTKDHKIILKDDFFLSYASIRPPYLKEFFDRLKESKHKCFKYQLIGPISFFKLIKDSKNSIQIVTDFLLIKYAKLLEEISSFHKCIFVLDEPLMFQGSIEEIIIFNNFIDKLSQISNCDIGVHLCCKLDPSIIELISCTFKNLDLNLYSSKEISSLGVLNFVGLADGGVSSQEIIGIIKPKLNVISYICPSCGLFYKNEESLKQVFNNLTLTKSQFLT